MRYCLYSFCIIKSQTALHHAVRYTITCGAVRLYYFADGFGVVCMV